MASQKKKKKQKKILWDRQSYTITKKGNGLDGNIEKEVRKKERKDTIRKVCLCNCGIDIDMHVICRHRSSLKEVCW